MPENHKNKRFICDYYSPGMIVVKIIRSTVPGGNIRDILIPELPADTGVIRQSDFPEEVELKVFNKKMPLLCDGKVRYEGEPILLLYGTDEQELEEIAGLIKIEYDTDYTLHSLENSSDDQIDKELNYKRGNPEAALKKAFQIIEEEYSTEAQNHYDLEPQGAYSFINDDKLEVICSTQWPYNVRDNVSSCLGIASTDVTISVPAMGKTHSGKLWYAGLLACFSAIVTWKTGRTSICLIPKTDSILYTPGRAASIIKHKTGLDESGKILCREIDISIDSGAYPMLSDEVINRICFSAAGVYKTKSMKIRARSLRTSSAPTGAFNGMGFHQGFFATESHSNSLSAAAGQSTYEWRLNNVAQEHINLPIGWEGKKPIRLNELLETVASISDFHRKYAAYKLSAQMQNTFSGGKRGIGIALCCLGNGFMGKVEESEKYTVSVRLNKNGSLLIMTSAVPENFQTAMLWKEIAGTLLEINLENVRIETTRTSLVPDSGPSLFSRNITIITQLIEKCCAAIKKSRFRLPLPIEVKRSYRLPRTNGWDPESFSGTPFPVISWGAAAVETETNPINLETAVRGVWFAADCGRIINRDMASAEVENEIYRSIESSMTKPALSRYTDFGISLVPAGIRDNIPMTIEFLSSKEMKPGGIGELPDSLIPSALTEAVSMSMKTKITRLPTTSEGLFFQLERQRKKEKKAVEN